MSYEVKTPLLLESVEVLRNAISGLEDGTMEGVAAGRLIAAARGLQSAVASDVKARLAAPRIAAYEAKLIENQAARVGAIEKRRESD